MREKRKRGQSSIEFTMIVGAMSFIMLGVFMVVQGRTLSIHREYTNTAMDQLGNIIRGEVTLASRAEGGYVREFLLPYSVRGYNYSALITGSTEISIKMGDSEYIVFTNSNVSGSMSKGRNIIRRDGPNITINSLEPGYSICPMGAGYDDENCGVIDCSGWYNTTDYKNCYNHKDITSNRCEDYQDCKDPNSEYCAEQDKTLAYSCTECQFIEIGDCTEKTRGTCSNYPAGKSCGLLGSCDGAGNCIGTISFLMKSNAGVNVMSLDESGNMILKGSCISGGACANPLDAFVLKNSAGTDVVAYVDNSGNLCIEESKCDVKDADCSIAPTGSLVFKNSENTVIGYLDNAGNLCLRGSLTEGGTP